jgi:hypothetical protein
MNTARLKKIADHLQNGKLGHQVFDYAVINKGNINKKGCKHCGNAIGELPFIFPQEWSFTTDGVLNHRTISNRWDAMCAFFEIDFDTINFLFFPRNDSYDVVNGNWLGKDATKEQVAEHIRRFIEKGGVYEKS